MIFTAKKSNLQGEILIPASKSHTIRAVAIATMAQGRSILRNPLESADARSAFRAAMEFGATIREENGDWIIDGIGGQISKLACFVDVANSGTSLRIFSALASLTNQEITFDGDASIRKRPMTPLLSALSNLGVQVKSQNEKCPFTVKGPMKGGQTRVNGISSQFLTALLFACPLAEGTSEITVDNLHERPYIEITLDWLRAQGIKFEQKGLDWFRIPGRQKYTAFDRPIPADFSTATFALCAAAITRSEVLIKGLDFADHQGDKKVFDFLQAMGVELEHTSEGVMVRGRPLKGLDIDMNDTPDALPALAVTACFAEGQTKLYNVAQARLKECDRISAITTELKKMGADIEEFEDGLIVRKSKLKGTQVHGYDDHRMVMSLALAGMGAEGLTEVDTAEAVAVTYPGFFNDFVALGAQMQKDN
ncbi:MAG: 3-phosphoshikimate 1-carboxyvinyltransferase [Bacteroidales bacterium]|nr:3-phosphoshikimate 1-carboxyvinyltransferase [Bacteroidales bacterium]